MGEFLRRHSYIIIWISALGIIGAAAVLIFDLNQYYPSTPVFPNPAAPYYASSGSSAPAQPSVTFMIEIAKSGNSLIVNWQNLPMSTAQLNIFRGKTGTPQNTWSLWKTISISPDSLYSGQAIIGLGTDDESGYSFYAEATNGSNDNGGGSPLWTSSSNTPSETTSTPPAPGNPGNQEQDQPPPENQDASSSPQNQNQDQNQNQNNEPSSSPQQANNDTSNTPQTPSGTPYYSPEIQISGYGSNPSGTFWVQHVDQKIQIGWQNISAQATDLVVVRAQDQTGPWSTVITQHDPNTTGPNSLQIVDNTVSIPYYYEMNVLAGTTTVATYGPLYLAGN